MTVADKQDRPDAEVSSASGPAPASDKSAGASVVRIVVGLVGLVVTGWLMFNIFLSFGLLPGLYFDNRLLIGLVAVTVGVGGAALLFYFLNMFVEGLPRRLSLRVIPYAYLFPGFGLIGLLLIYPAIQTINYSFANNDATAYVGLENYTSIFADSRFRESLINNLLWLIFVPAITVAIGIIVAVLADRLSPRGEKVAKSLIFLPMAISFVGASAIWGTLIYAYSPGEQQSGLLNAIWTGLGGDAQAWLQIDSARLNSFLLMVILIWLQVGFAMILLSSAIKGVPEDTLEAARIDGATEWQIFWRVIIPQIKGTIITVFITVLILVLKVFDIVFVLTNGRFSTNVIANLYYNLAFAQRQNGLAAAVVVILLIAVTPVLVYQVRHFRAEEANR